MQKNASYNNTTRRPVFLPQNERKRAVDGINDRKEPNAEISIDEIDRMEEHKEWIKFAQTDFDCAEYLYRAPLHPRPLNVICYHCQQAAEKAIKALIVYFGSQGGMPKGHDLSFLLNQEKNMIQSQKGIEITHDFMVMADGLSKYGVAPRYQTKSMWMNLKPPKPFTTARRLWNGLNRPLMRRQRKIEITAS